MKDKITIDGVKYVRADTQCSDLSWDEFIARRKRGETTDNPSEEVQLEEVKKSGYAIQYIHNPSETVQIEAVKETRYAIEYIHNPSEAVKKAANII